MNTAQKSIQEHKHRVETQSNTYADLTQFFTQKETETPTPSTQEAVKAERVSSQFRAGIVLEHLRRLSFYPTERGASFSELMRLCGFNHKQKLIRALDLLLAENSIHKEGAEYRFGGLEIVR